MLETILLGTFFFSGEPEQFLFMLYTFIFIWSSAMRSVSHPPVFAPHTLDIVAASTDVSASNTAVCEGIGEMAATCSSASYSEIISTMVSKKYCGRSVGEVAATCGIPIAVSVYFDPQRLRLVPEMFINDMIDDGTKRKIRKKIRSVMSYVLGVTVNFIGDVENWWAAQNSFKADSTATETDL